MDQVEPRPDQSTKGPFEHIETLAAALPEGYHNLGPHHESDQALLSICFEAGTRTWEVEFCALDGGCNFSVSGPDLVAVLDNAVSNLGALDEFEVDRKDTP